MNYRMILHLLGTILSIEGALMLVPLFVSLYYGESITAFLITIILTELIFLPIALIKPKDKQIYAKEGFVTVSVSWILMSVFGALPFILGGTIPSFTDAFFETVSGFTTTGATILAEVESLPRGILFWRSFTHWIGGMGILVFVLAILPFTGGQTMHLMRAEVPGPTKGKLVPKMRQTAIILYLIYLGMTIIQTAALCLCGLSLYDSLLHTFATAGTGGFSTLNNSVAGFNNPAAEWVIAIFMFLFGVNFNIYFFILIGRIKDIFRSEELRAYFAICFVSTAAIAINIASSFERLGACIRTSFFQVSSIMTTTGFTTLDFNEWPVFSKTILMLLMIIGASAGSTAGGLKVSRFLILVKGIFREIKQMIHPRSVGVVRLDGEVVPDETVHAANKYFSVYMLFIFASTLIISFDAYSIETNFIATLSTINNIGPLMGDIGALGNFSGYSPISTAILAFNMLIGRLEIMPIIILFSPVTWKKR